MNICPVCSLMYNDVRQFCTKCGARLFPKDKPTIIEWLSPTSFIEY
ncbi:MAG: hypothetical protein AABW61_01445 [Candidatus Aenigmatarchaeota archaeon]